MSTRQQRGLLTPENFIELVFASAGRVFDGVASVGRVIDHAAAAPKEGKRILAFVMRDPFAFENDFARS